MKRPKLALIIAVFVLLIIIFLSWRAQHAEAPSGRSNVNPTSTPAFDKSRYSLDDPASPWVVVNKKRPLSPRTYAPADLASISRGQFMRAEAAPALAAMIAGAKDAGYILYPASGYRSYSTQVGTYNAEVNSFGQAKADTESAKPGYSEHQTGWAVDIGSYGCIEDCFAKTPAAKWVLANATKYGFVVRYPLDKDNTTGYRYEPWHIRYVGQELSLEMIKQSMTTLEEFFGLPPAPTY